MASDLRMQGILVTFYSQNVVSTAFNDLLSNCLLAAHRINRYDRIFQREQIEEFGNGRDLI